MQFIKPDTNIDFIGKRKIAFTLSIILIVASIGSLIVHCGPRYGIDFAGGTLVQIKFNHPTEINAIKSGLAAIDMKNVSVQSFGTKDDNEYLIRTDRKSVV